MAWVYVCYSQMLDSVLFLRGHVIDLKESKIFLLLFKSGLEDSPFGMSLPDLKDTIAMYFLEAG